MNTTQGGALAARRVHTPEVAGSIPALATPSTLAGRGLPEACHSSSPRKRDFAAARVGGGIFLH